MRSIEFGNGFSELNDAEDQAARFQAQVDAKAGGDDEGESEFDGGATDAASTPGDVPSAGASGPAPDVRETRQEPSEVAGGAQTHPVQAASNAPASAPADAPTPAAAEPSTQEPTAQGPSATPEP